MKFIVSSSVLQKHLNAISGVLNSSNTLGILDNFLFDLKGKTLTASASDLGNTMTTEITTDMAEGEGMIAVPAKVLLDTLKTFPDQPLTFTIDEKTFLVEILSDNGKYKLCGLNGVEFPKTPVITSPGKIELSAELLHEAISKTLFATGNDEMRPVMSGVYFELSKDNLCFVATDAHKLVRYTRTDKRSTKEASLIIPKKPLNLLKGLLSSTSSAVSIEYSSSHAFFKLEDFSLICRLIDGKYPNYNAVIPKENPNKLTIDRMAFLNSVRRLSIFSNKTTHQVRLKIAGSELNLSAEDLDYQNEAAERLTCQYDGEDMEIGFNSRFLLEMLNHLESETIKLEMSASNRAGLLSPGEASSEHESILMLVMPVMLNS